VFAGRHRSRFVDKQTTFRTSISEGEAQLFASDTD